MTTVKAIVGKKLLAAGSKLAPSAAPKVASAVADSAVTIGSQGLIAVSTGVVLGTGVGVGLEIGYKLTHGGMNDVCPWRQEWLNKIFPDDETKIWTESKAAIALHNRAMGNPHDSVRDKMIKSFPKEK